jgi:hypothetical protein
LNGVSLKKISEDYPICYTKYAMNIEKMQQISIKPMQWQLQEYKKTEFDEYGEMNNNPYAI